MPRSSSQAGASQPVRRSAGSRLLILVTLIIAGEAVFGLPFVLARVFRPTLLDVLGITNLQLGTAMSIYGVVAMLSYFPGGLLADRFAARRLLAIALAATAAGGLLYARLPGQGTLGVLYGFWGLSTILLFWSPLLRATREWGGGSRPGRAFGLLDGGRGLVSAVLASVTVAVFAGLLPADVASATLEQRSQALQRVILIFSAVAALAAVLVWWVVPERTGAAEAPVRAGGKWGERLAVLRRPAVWLHGVIVVCAYVGFKSLDDLPLYARDGFGMNDVEAASVGAFAMYIRPPAAVLAGLLGDRFGVSRIAALSFLAMAVVTAGLGVGLVPASAPTMFLGVVAATCAAVFAVRGIYFALVDEAAVPWHATGTAIGFVSVMGFTPDIFFGPLMGFLTDRTPGIRGHEHLFLVVSAFAAAGLVATVLFARVSRDAQELRPPAVGSE